MMKPSMTSMAATIAVQEAQIRALQEEVAKLRERVAVTEARGTPYQQWPGIVPTIAPDTSPWWMKPPLIAACAGELGPMSGMTVPATAARIN